MFPRNRECRKGRAGNLEIACSRWTLYDEKLDLTLIIRKLLIRSGWNASIYSVEAANTAECWETVERSWHCNYIDVDRVAKLI